MYNHFYQRTRQFLSALCVSSLGLSFMATSCTDNYDLDDGRYYPCWLGGSIYEELQNPANSGFLEGTFTNYIRLIDDLGYAETLNRTGSKTLFIANDEAFERFYQNNSWGVKKYEDLTVAMKKQLLYSSMLDNAILLEMMSNVSNGSTEVKPGIAMKHELALDVIDTITTISKANAKDILPEYNTYWDYYRDNGIHMVMDGTKPMMVHFTQEQMTANSITTTGSDSDFEIITGSSYNQDEGTAFVFKNKVIKADVKCQNGYIQQMQDVVVPPGNLAELIRTNGESNYFSQMIERFSCPFYNSSLTKQYNDLAANEGRQTIDSIFEKRYFSVRSQGGSSLSLDPYSIKFPQQLTFDPGWNQYTSGAAGSNSLSDIGVIFVPNDAAMEQYFLPGGDGQFLIDRYGTMPNTKENLKQNIADVPLNVIHAFVTNLMQNSFVATVPSKFSSVMDDAADVMGLSKDCIAKTSDGKYDVKIANNGVAYMLNKVFAPKRYVAVSSPTLLNDNMKIMNALIDDGYEGYKPFGYGLNYYAYLLSMSSNYALFVPVDEAFGHDQENGKDWILNKCFYIDPSKYATNNPRALRFYKKFNDDNSDFTIECEAYKYDKTTGTVGDIIKPAPTSSEVRSQLVDLLNMHTIVLKPGEVLGTNNYYKTKHGGTVQFIPGKEMVVSGSQIDNGFAESRITKTERLTNGYTYTIDHLISSPFNSVYTTLQNNSDRFSMFMELCNFDQNEMRECLYFASDLMKEQNEITKRERWKAYQTFTKTTGMDYNVNYFNSFNYTVLAPNNEAMQKAYDNGLPHWEEIKALKDKYSNYNDEHEKENPEVQQARDKALAMVYEINDFIRYHFFENSIYADNVIEQGEYSTTCADSLGIKNRVYVSGGGGTLTVRDNRGKNINMSASNGLLVNTMARDYEFGSDGTASTIRTSSFAAIHETNTPLNMHKNSDRYDSNWAEPNAARKLAAFRRLFETKLYKLYK